MAYIPHTKKDIEEMLRVVGCESLESLFDDIPKEVRLSDGYNLPTAMSEPELIAWMQKLSEKNANLDQKLSFLGAGCYEHFIPVLVDSLSGRSEFWTAYTPYQPEASQGNLQAIFEYQSMICELTNMDAANASMYDGATAMAEAMLLSYFHHKPKRTVAMLSPSLHPEYVEVAHTYANALGDLQIATMPEKDGRVDVDSLALNDKVAVCIVSSPNFYGLIENGPAIAQKAHGVGALMVSVVNPISLAILEPPGSYGADLAIGDGQPLGVPMSYGGPTFGFFAAKEEHIRKMPGRICGQTVDKDGKRGYVLTLQTREQHIRREKATSNICTNQALMALRSLIYMTTLGKEGIREVANQCIQKAHYLANAIQKIPGFSLCYTGPFFHEFVVHCPKPAREILASLENHGILGGIPLDQFFANRTHDLLVTVTECKSREQLDRMVEALKKSTQKPGTCCCSCKCKKE